MKNRHWLLKISSLTLIGAIGLISSCKDEERLTAADTQDITEEAVTDAYFQDMDDMAGVAIEAPSDDQYSGSGRVSTVITIQDQRFGCEGIVVTVVPADGSTLEHPKGTLTVDFGTTGCLDNNNNVRTGKLIFTYDKWRFQPGATIITTTDNYTINGIKLEGTRTLTNVTGSSEEAPKFNVMLDGGVATFPDNSTATRTSNITWQWDRGEPGPTDDLLVIEPAHAEGTTRGGRHYEVDVLEALKYKRFCGGLAVDGIKKYTIDESKEIVIDYGDGTCDKSVTITVNGVTRDINVN